jgi:hypothetical protein
MPIDSVSGHIRMTESGEPGAKRFAFIDQILAAA